MGAFAANHTHDFSQVVKQVAMVDRSNQFDMAEMSRTVDLGAHASFAKTVPVHGAHQVVIDSVGDLVTVLLVGRLFIDLSH